VTELALTIPDELVEAIAERVAAMLEEWAPADDRRSPWFTVAEAADYLRCSRQRVYDLKSSGRLPAGQDGSRPLFHRAVLDAYLTGGDARAIAERLPRPRESREQNGRVR
jgi:excisionase family DNA binding protein